MRFPSSAKRRLAFGLLAAQALLVLAHAPAGGAEPAWFRVIVHRPGYLSVDGGPPADLSGAAGRAPVPWRDFVMTLVPAAPGAHRFELKPVDPDVLPPYESVEATAAAGDTVTVRLGRPRIVTSPEGAAVMIGGRPAGTTPLSVDPGDLVGAEVLVRRDGFREVAEPGDSLLAASVASGSVRVELEALPHPAPVEGASKESGPFWVRHRGIALGGTVTLLVAGGWAGLHFKHLADRRFRDYQLTGNTARQRDLFRDAERFDRLSLVGWGVGEAAFLASFFLLIHETPRPFIPTAAIEPEWPTGAPRCRVGITHVF